MSVSWIECEKSIFECLNQNQTGDLNIEAKTEEYKWKTINIRKKIASGLHSFMHIENCLFRWFPERYKEQTEGL
jgi:hypothetical protein